jgi:hypothetical protein
MLELFWQCCIFIVFHFISLELLIIQVFIAHLLWKEFIQNGECFVDQCLSFCTFSFGHCVVCSSSIYRFWLPPFGIFKLFFMQNACLIFYICINTCYILNTNIGPKEIQFSQVSLAYDYQYQNHKFICQKASLYMLSH